MRQWIDIIKESWGDEDEDDDRDEYGFDPFIQAVKSELNTHGSSASVEEIEDARRELDSRTMRDPLILYRFMRLPMGFIRELEAGEELGQSWTTNPSMPTDNLYDADKHAGEPMFLIAAEARYMDIAEEHSVAFNILFPEEDEVFLMPRAELKLVGVYYQGQKKNLRPDLVGQFFRAV
jgi:hypothetical protein